MAQFRWIIMSSFLLMEFSFRAAAAEIYSTYTVRVGDEVTLPCKSVRDDQDQCDSTTWTSSKSGNTVTLFEHGQIHKEAEAKSDRLRVTEECSLVLKKVTDEEAGSYTCTHFRPGQQQGQDSWVDLAVVTLTEHEDADTVTFKCSVSTEGCGHKVKWLYEGEKTDVETTQRSCSAIVRFTTSHQWLNSNELFKCEVTDTNSEEVQLFSFRTPQSSGEKPDDDATTTATTTSPTSVKMSTNKTASENNDNGTKQEGWWWLLGVVSVGVAALLIISVSVFRWKRTKGNKTQVDENMVDPEGGVSYASISYTKKTNGEARVGIHDDDDDDDDEGDAVTYSTVKASSSSSSAAAEASADVSDLYATVNKPNK